MLKTHFLEFKRNLENKNVCTCVCVCRPESGGQIKVTLQNVGILGIIGTREFVNRPSTFRVFKITI